ncbi:lysophosphatidylserine lipase ABHD12-like [Diadema antillarum]|uniref:lysophosphatidylserine lipase ABHD12-like n=1 Tax=Diadema antillarum TaxID=105358 RepID=UPI003A8509B7
MNRHRGKTSSKNSKEEHSPKEVYNGVESTPTGPGQDSAKRASGEHVRKRKRAVIWSWTWKICILNSFLFYFIVPILILCIPDIASQLIFLSYVRCPIFRNYHEPQTYGLAGARNIYLPSTDGVTLGVWQVLPRGVAPEDGASEIPAEFFDAALADERPVVMYCHGNSGSRANPHRVEVYKVLSNLGYHVVAVDYRGYGDSSSYTTPEGIHDDVLTVYRWLRAKTGDSPFFIWGHSLGTGISTVFTSKICREEECPTGLILEAPFNNLLDETMRHPFGLPWNVLPYSRLYFDMAFNVTAPYFQSDKSIPHVTCPILFLHAEDDWIVPFDLGKKLYEVAMDTRPPTAGPVKFVSFGAEGFGHKNIAFSPKLPPILRDFIK